MPSVAAVILVGGKARRLDGADKSQLLVGPKTCLEWTLDILTNQVDRIVLNVGQKDRYDHSKNHDVIFDWPSDKDVQGVAFGILGSLAWAREAGHSAIISTPVDTPLLPQTFAPVLMQESDGCRPSVFRTAEGLQGLHAIWPVSCLDKMKAAILNEDILKISSLHATLNSNEIQISTDEAFRFTNVNSEKDLRAAERYISIRQKP